MKKKNYFVILRQKKLNFWLFELANLKNFLLCFAIISIVDRRLALGFEDENANVIAELSGRNAGSTERLATTQCVLEDAEECFTMLFDKMPICSVPSVNASQDLTFRCQHFNVLDTCFRKKSLICLPNAIGQLAKNAYQKKMLECMRSKQSVKANHKKHKTVQHHQKSGVTLISARSTKSVLPTELQFVSLFGYLQTQCRRRTSSLQLRRTAGQESEENNSNSQRQERCSNAEMRELLFSCETEVRQRSSATQHFDLDRHQLLRIKLDASSKLLEYAETRKEEECLMVRAVLSDIFLIHQKYCLQTFVTKCVCQQLNLKLFCGINCAGLEAFSLPFNQRLSWITDFRGQLIANSSTKCNFLMSIYKYVLLFLAYYFI